MAKFSDDVKTAFNDMETAITSLNNATYNFNQYYDSFIFDNLMDATLLKDKMSEIIAEVYNDDIQ